jgi:hypothetical protein
LASESHSETRRANIGSGRARRCAGGQSPPGETIGRVVSPHCGLPYEGAYMLAAECRLVGQRDGGTWTG